MIVSTASELGTLIVKKRVFEVVSLVGKLVQEYVQIVDSMTPDNGEPSPTRTSRFHFLSGYFLYNFILDNSNFQKTEPSSASPEGLSFRESFYYI